MDALIPVCIAPSLAADIIAGRIGNLAEPNILSRFTPQQSSDVAPAAILGGAASTLQGPDGLYYDAFVNHLWVADFNGQKIHVFHADASGDATPLRSTAYGGGVGGLTRRASQRIKG